ncbi:ROK family transcriptional regulator [Nonomuraea sp. NN258]|uniref:ROK family transcriptional regulator n=1 Tax=Nonomuraea antri TaxID=2730852 RepID=UPI0015699FF6|nr:ROK family transcriptional regulator [Nonomuraea antri]NRQ37503.1 ROK family transcriptional regulator [Nonomuraea antri]
MSSRKASAGLIRAINDRLALDLMIELGPLSRAQLVEHTGLAKPTVAELLDRLLEAGLIGEAGQAGEGRSGPNARTYAVIADRAHVAGAELRAAEVHAVVADITGRTVGTAVIVTRPKDNSISLVGQAIAEAAAKAGIGVDDLHGVVVGTPGIVDPATGDMAFSFDLPSWHHGPLSQLREELGLAAVFENEVNLSALAEHRLGAGRDREDFALLSLGTGIGMALVLGGRLRRGSGGGAGEVGYLPVYGSTLQRMRQRRGGRYKGGFQGRTGAAAVLALAREHGLRGRTVADVLRDGGQEFLAEVAGRIALGIASVCAVVDPGLVVLTGEVGRACGPLARRIEAEVADLTPLRPRIVTSAVEGNSVLRGAVLMALETVRDEIYGPGRRQ